MIAVRPKMRNTLAIFEPTTLPTTTSDESFTTAIIEVTISGSDVPSATMVTPTIKIKKMLLSLTLKGGYTLENPVGTIAGEDNVTIGGFWMGADLGLGILIK